MLLRADKPLLRIFISVDIINSTKYKVNLSKNNTSIQPWLVVFKDFYKYFPTILNDMIDETKRKDDFSENIIFEPLKIWKLLGDEIIFYSELSDSRACGLYIGALKQTIKKFEDDYLPKELPLKACSWLAGFPVNNTEFNIEGKQDFLGPSIDLGFRLMNYASSKKLTISVDLALILSRKTELDIKYFFDGFYALKGVFNNKEYPIISIDMRNNDELEVMTTTENGKILKFCKTFIEENLDFINIPFIQNDKANEFDKKPANYEDKLLELNKLYEHINYDNNINIKQSSDNIDANIFLKALTNEK